MQISIDLGTTGALGTRATVTRRRWWGAKQTSVYVCHKAGLILGAQWINEKSGAAADETTAYHLNNAAQAAARLAGLA